MNLDWECKRENFPDVQAGGPPSSLGGGGGGVLDNEIKP